MQGHVSPPWPWGFRVVEVAADCLLGAVREPAGVVPQSDAALVAVGDLVGIDRDAVGQVDDRPDDDGGRRGLEPFLDLLELDR